MPIVYLESPPPARGNGIAIFAMVTGLIGLILTVVTGWIPIVGFFLMLLPTLLAIIFGVVGRGQAKLGAPHGAKASVGLTCGVVSLLLTVAMQLCWGLMLGGVAMSAAEIAHEGGFDELHKIHEVVHRSLEADWEQLKGDRSPLEIEIDDIKPEPEGAVSPEPSDTNLEKLQVVPTPVDSVPNTPAPTAPKEDAIQPPTEESPII